ncbi:unnamed protein product [Aphanomyces euteiches]|uniref:Histidine acid phosphatase n=1 Tax=Aphanomyces euteiches TaxID=100861 RepID=A0A6G0XJR4_9STRA|nr:hypothetical protein Ae201684_003953 [Aphanomyces euteiches]KAH9084939.1 hypothetical protein Ae201684P_002171 [Aphanomyces euteiches]KAH9157312.1 hypothetical protein AeRB84_000842 [Aphanomyces euteiches]
MSQDDLELVHVMLVFRHGDRSPVMPRMGKKIVTDEREKVFWAERLITADHEKVLDKMAKPAGLTKADPAPTNEIIIGGRWPNGYLTQLGSEQMTARGKAMRAKYDDFLKDAKPDDIYVRSTNVPRTIRSAQSVLLGMFPEHLHSDDIHVHLDPNCRLSMGKQMDYFNMSTKLKHRRHESPLKEIDELEKLVADAAGLDEGEDVKWSFLREILICRKAHELPFPEGLDEEVLEKTLVHNAWEWHATLGNKPFLKEAFGGGVQEVMGYLEAAKNGFSQHKLTLLSGHDDTLTALLVALQLSKPGVTHLLPHYGSMIVFELWRSKTHADEWFVAVTFDDENIFFVGHTDSVFCPFSHVEHLASEYRS